MSLVTYRAETWSWLEVQGEPDDWGVHEDDGLVDRLVDWMSAEQIDWHANHAGGGRFAGRISLADAGRVIAWLEANGATRERT